jgi:hypothetical protein
LRNWKAEAMRFGRKAAPGRATVAALLERIELLERRVAALESPPGQAQANSRTVEDIPWEAIVAAVGAIIPEPYAITSVAVAGSESLNHWSLQGRISIFSSHTTGRR